MIKLLLIGNLVLLTLTCSHFYNNTLILTSTQQEIVNIPLNSIFLNNDFTNIQLSEQSQQLNLVNQIHLHNTVEEKVKFENKTIISSKFQKVSQSLDSLHYFSILSKSSDNQYYIETTTNVFNTLPIFDKSFTFALPNSVCYDFVQIEQDFIVDCKNNDDYYFAYLNSDKIEYFNITTSQYTMIKKLDQIDNYIYRNTVDRIELYQLQNGQIKFISELNKTNLATLIKKVNFELIIIDFKTHTNGQLSIMNEHGELIILEYQNNEFILIEFIDVERDTIFGYDYDAYTKTYVVILDGLLQYKAITEQTFVTNITQHIYTRVFLTNDYIVLQLGPKIIVYNLFLYQINSITLSTINYITVLSSRYNEFFEINKQFVNQYLLINDPILRFQSNIISDQYQQISVRQSYTPFICDVTIQYKVVNLDSTEIYNTQLNDGLFSEPILIDNPKAKIAKTFQGPNLKYEFENNNKNFSFQIQQTQEFIFNNEVKNYNFRKIFYYQPFNSIYLIQQSKIDLQLTGYTCDYTNELSLRCQNLFIQNNFIELQMSETQLWWLNYDSLFLAVQYTNKIDIYCIFYQVQTFKLLTTINKEAKQITTNGQYLIVSLQEGIEIYQVTVQEKAKLIMNMEKAEKVFASRIHPDIFIYNQNILSLYNLEQQKISLVWYETIEQNLEINIAFLNSHFILFLELENNKQKALTYNYENRRNIYQQKQLNFYDSVNLKQIEINIQNNLIFITGTNTQTQKTSLLVYKINTMAQDALFTIIETATKTQFSSAYNYLILLNEQGEQTNYYLTGENIISVQMSQNYKQLNYTSIAFESGKVYNQLNIQLLEDIPYKIVNRGTQLFQIKNKLNLTYINDNSSIHCVDLNQTWYSGQAVDLIQINQTQIQYLKTITKLNQTLSFTPQILEFDSETFISIKENKIIMTSKESFLQTESEFKTLFEFQNILVIKDNFVFIEVTEQDIFGYQLYVFECKNMKCEIQQTPLNFEFRLRYAFLDQNYFFLLIGNEIIVYDTKGAIFNISQYEKILTISSQLYCRYLLINHIKQDIYQFIAVDFKGNIEFIYQDVQQPEKHYSSLYDTIQNLKNNQQYTPPEENLVGLFFTKEKNRLILVFWFAGTYAYNYEIDCSRNELCELKEFELVDVYQQYGDAALFNLFQNTYMSENILSIVYLVKDHYELLLFNANQLQEKQSGPRLTLGGLKSPSFIPGQFYQVQSLVYSYKNKLYLLASAENKDILNHYQLLRYPQFCIESDKFEEQLSFQLSNNYTNIDVELQISIDEKINPGPNPDPVDPDNDKGKFPFWIIILIIIVIAIFGFAIYMYCRNRKYKVDEVLLGN